MGGGRGGTGETHGLGLALTAVAGAKATVRTTAVAMATRSTTTTRSTGTPCSATTARSTGTTGRSVTLGLGAWDTVVFVSDKRGGNG